MVSWIARRALRPHVQVHRGGRLRGGCRFAILAVAFLLMSQGLAGQDRATVLHWNDFHGQVLPRGEVGGIHGLDHLVQSIRSEVGRESVLLVDAGDWFQGTPEGNVPKGRMIVDLFNAVGVDVATVGNHDFDFGQDNLRELVERSKYPVLGANVLTPDGQMWDYLRSYVVREVGGIKLGVVGLLSPDTPSILPNAIGAELRVGGLAETMREVIPRMRADGAECIVVLSHCGVDPEKALAEEVPGIDLIVGGHSHTTLEKPWIGATHGTVVVQTGLRGANLGRVEIVRRAGGGFDISGRLLPVAKREESRPHVERVVREYAAQVSGVIDEVIGTAKTTLAAPNRKARFPRSSPLGSWMCEVLAETTGQPIVLHNKGGIRAGLTSGPITRRALYEASPFGNYVAVCQFTGENLEALVRYCLETPKRRIEARGLQIRWQMIDERPTFHSLLVEGEPVDPAAVYTVATNSYLADGGDGWDAFPQVGEPILLEVDIYAASVKVLTDSRTADGTFAPEMEDAYLQLGTWANRATSLFGLFALLGIAVVFSRSRKNIALRVVAWGVGLQALFAFLVLETAAGQWFFTWIKSLFVAIMDYAKAGNDMVFGPLADAAALGSVFGRDFVFFTQILGTIVLVSTLTAVLYHIGILQLVVYGMAKIMQWTMRTSGAESLASAANVFVGQTEAPLTVRPYLKGMTSSEIMSMMTGGMATVAGGVLAAYAGFGIDAGHLLAASVMSAPAALVVAKILVPETEESQTGAHVPFEVRRSDVNLLDAMCRGASEGFKLALNVMAMLIALVSVVALLNGTIDWIYQRTLAGMAQTMGDLPPSWPDTISLQWALGKVFQPFAWLLGVPWSEADEVGSLLGTRMILNEFLAYLDLATVKEVISPRSTTLATYALCGFANFSSIAIQIGGISGLEGSLRSKLARLGFLSMVGGTIATMMTAAIVGVFL